MNTVEGELYTPPAAWSGRDYGPGPEHARWHSAIDTSGSGAWRDSVAVLGFATDEGVERNGGRQGAARGPEALRAALGGLALHHAHPLVDAGTVTTQGADLEGAQCEVSDRVRELAGAGNLAVVLGGGHETSFATAPRRLRGARADARDQLRRPLRPARGGPPHLRHPLPPGDHLAPHPQNRLPTSGYPLKNRVGAGPR